MGKWALKLSRCFGNHASDTFIWESIIFRTPARTGEAASVSIGQRLNSGVRERIEVSEGI